MGWPKSEFILFREKDASFTRYALPAEEMELDDLSFSPDSKSLVFVANKPTSSVDYILAEGARDVWRMDLATGAFLRVATSPRGAFRHPAVSPDGKRIAYFRRTDGQTSSSTPTRDVGYRICELDLASQVETGLSNHAVSVPMALFYAGHDAWYFSRINIVSNDGIAAFRLERNDPLDATPTIDPPAGVAPPSAALVDVTAAGEPVLLGRSNDNRMLATGRAYGVIKSPAPPFAHQTYRNGAMETLTPCQTAPADLTSDTTLWRDTPDGMACLATPTPRVMWNDFANYPFHLREIVHARRSETPRRWKQSDVFHSAPVVLIDEAK